MSAPLLSAKLVELRQSKGISQKEIAASLGVTREAYSHYERCLVKLQRQLSHKEKGSKN